MNGLYQPSRLRWRHFLSLLLLFLSSRVYADPATVDYVRLQIKSFIVHVNPEMVADPTLLKKTLDRLQVKLGDINSLLKPEQLSILHKVHFWIERAHDNGAAEFHYSREWLKEHGYNEDKEHGIEISNSRNFLEW